MLAYTILPPSILVWSELVDVQEKEDVYKRKPGETVWSGMTIPVLLDEKDCYGWRGVPHELVEWAWWANRTDEGDERLCPCFGLQNVHWRFCSLLSKPLHQRICRISQQQSQIFPQHCWGASVTSNSFCSFSRGSWVDGMPFRRNYACEDQLCIYTYFDFLAINWPSLPLLKRKNFLVIVNN